MATKYLDDNGLLYLWQKIRTTFVSDVAWDSTNKKLQKKKKTGANGAEETTDLVTFATVATSGSYNDLSNKPTIPTLKNVFGKVKVGATTIEADTTQDTLELVAGNNITLTPDATNDKVTIAGDAGTLVIDYDTTNHTASATYSEVQAALTAGKSIYLFAHANNAIAGRYYALVSYDTTYTNPLYAFSSFENANEYEYTLDSTDTWLNGGATAFSKTSHTHGNITSAGALQTTDVAIASGDKLVVTDSSNSNKIARTSLSFDGSTTTKALTQNGTFETFATSDTKNTAGSTDSSSKLFLIGATSQAANPQTYSQDTTYVGTDGHLYSDSKQVVNLSGSQALTNKTYDGYTLGAACEKGVITSISSDSTDVPTVTAVKNYVSSAVTGATAFQGIAPTTFAPTNYSAGYYWVVGTAGTYATQTCEAGDMIFCINNYSSAYSASDFDVVQTNLDITQISNADIDTIVAS